MCFDDCLLAVDRTDTFAEVSDQFLRCRALPGRGHFPVEVTDKANSERDVVQVVAMHVPAIDLAGPMAPDFDLAIPGGGPIPNDEMVGQPIHHLAHVPVIVL